MIPEIKITHPTNPNLVLARKCNGKTISARIYTRTAENKIAPSGFGVVAPVDSFDKETPAVKLFFKKLLANGFAEEHIGLVKSH